MDINGRCLEYIENGHIYLVDGILVPSITQILKFKFGGMYEGINKNVLKKASERGTYIHEAIEKYCRYGEDDGSKEVHDFKFLEKRYGFEVLDNEVPVILEKDGNPIGAGRLDLVLEINGHIGGADIKTTSTLHKEYVAYQLNLYRIAYRQSYGEEWEFLKAIHLKDGKRKFIDLPINEEMTWRLLDDWQMERKTEEGREVDTYFGSK